MQTRVWQTLLILCLLFLTVVMRLPLLGSSLWLDEAAQVLESARPLAEQIQIRDDFQPPLLHLVLWSALHISTQEWWLRLVAAVFPAILVSAALVVLGKQWGRFGTGWLAGIFWAISSFAIFFSQELRPYVLPTAWYMLSWVFLSRWYVHRRARDQWFWAGLSVAGLYTTYLYPFGLFGQLLWIVWVTLHQKPWQKELRSWCIASCGVVMCFLPWLPFFFDQLQAGQQLRQDLPGWETVVSFSQAKSLFLVGAKLIFGVIDIQVSSLFFLVTGLFAVLFLLLVSFGRGAIIPDSKLHARTRHFWGMLIVASFFPVFCAWLISFIVPVLQPKRVLFTFPFFFLLFAELIRLPWRVRFQELRQKRHLFWHVQWLVMSLLFCFLIGSLHISGTWQYWHDQRLQREDWRGMHQQITQQFPRAVVIHAFPAAFAPWRWYDDGALRVEVTGALVTTSITVKHVVARLPAQSPVLVFDYLRDLTDPERLIDQELAAAGWKETARLTPTTPLGIIHVWQKGL